jgi:hypothetical protein
MAVRLALISRGLGILGHVNIHKICRRFAPATTGKKSEASIGLNKDNARRNYNRNR